MNLKEMIEPIAPSIEAKVQAGANAATYTGGTIAILGGTWTKNEIMAAGGLVFVALTYFTSLYFQRRRDRREQEFHLHRIWMQNQMAQQDKDEASK